MLIKNTSHPLWAPILWAGRITLLLTTNTNIPVSVQYIPDRYNITTRHWSIGFHRLIIALHCRPSVTSPQVLEHLMVFINYAYHLYTALLEECNLEAFRGKWLEALRSLHGKINSALTQEPYSQTQA